MTGLWNRSCLRRSRRPYRHQALSLRLRRRSNGRRLYEAAFYWHMRTDEKAAHDAEEAAWRTQIQNGMAFGTHVTMGPLVDVRLDIGEVLELSDRLGFDGVEIVHLASSATHRSPAERRAAGT